MKFNIFEFIFITCIATLVFSLGIVIIVCLVVPPNKPQVNVTKDLSGNIVITIPRDFK